MSDPRVLLVGTRENLPAPPGHNPSKALLVEISCAATDAVQRAGEKEFDAVVCWAEGPEELAGLIRVRKAAPRVPIVVVTSQEDSGFETLARQIEATRLLRAGAGIPAVLEIVRLALRSGELAGELLPQAQAAQQLAEDVRTLARETHSLIREARSEHRKAARIHFVPLVVEDDPNQALLTVRAFERADVVAPLPILGSAEEAIAYLSGAGAYADRERYPLPTIVLLDKPTSFNAFIELICSLERHWGTPRPDADV